MKNPWDEELWRGVSDRSGFDLGKRHDASYVQFVGSEGERSAPSVLLDQAVFDAVIRPGDRTADVGANVGFTALQMLQAGAGVVHCFEPDERVCSRLRALADGDDRLVVHEVGIGGADADAELHVSESHEQGSSFDKPSVDRWTRTADFKYGAATVTRPVRTLAGYGRFDFVKIDIEGWERQALEGYSEFLRPGSKPRAVYLESYPDHLPGILALMRPVYSRAYFVEWKEGRVVAAAARPGSARRKSRCPPMYLFTDEAVDFSA